MQSFPLSFGAAHVACPEASAERCTAALILDLDPVALVRGRPAGPDGDGGTGPLAQYVNDRPYVASSFLSVAIGKVLGSALGGRGPRPDLAASALPFSATLGPVRVRGGAAVAERLFRPLGYAVSAEPVADPSGGAPLLWMLTLSATMRLQALLSHLHVLVPVLDDDKHYRVSEDEIDKLLRHGEGWLPAHPDRELIARRYLRRGPRLARQALGRLAALDAEASPEPEPDPAAGQVEEPASLNDLRHQAVLQVLQECGATSVLDLGCGEERLLRLLLADRRFARIVGADISTRALDAARERLRLDRLPDRQRGRVTLLQSALTYRDRRLSGFDAAALVEVVEHVEPARLSAFAQAVFGHARPGAVVLTTPNRDWNATVPALAGDKLRHRDHRFEWSRAEFAAWAAGIAARFGYRAELSGVGEPHPGAGPPHADGGVPMRLTIPDFAAVIYGHTPVPSPEWVNRTLCIDTGCVFGGQLTALRWPERALLSVPAARAYAEPVRPIAGAPILSDPYDLPDLEDVSGKRIVTTALLPAVTVRAERGGRPGGDEPLLHRPALALLSPAHHVARGNQRARRAAGAS